MNKTYVTRTEWAIDKAKNLTLAMLIFGAIGAYLGYSFHASLTVGVKPVASVQTSK